MERKGRVSGHSEGTGTGRDPGKTQPGKEAEKPGVKEKEGRLPPGKGGQGKEEFTEATGFDSFNIYV